MTIGSFPDDPHQRKAILVLNAHDVEKCAYEPAAAQALLDEEAFVLQLPFRVDDTSPLALRNISDSRLARSGALLVQSPYDLDAYEEVTQAPQQFALAKHMYFSSLCMLLGAKEVSVEQIDLRTNTGKSTLNVKADGNKVAAELDVDRQNLEKLRAHMSLKDEFSGGPANLVSAERLLRQTGLWSDPNLRTLFEMRRGGTNQLKSRQVVLSLSSEAKSNLHVAGRLKVPSFIKLSADYKTAIHEQRDYSLTVLVRF